MSDVIVIRPGQWTEIPELFPVSPCYSCGKQGYPWRREGTKILALFDNCDFTIGNDEATITPHWESCSTKRRCNCCGK